MELADQKYIWKVSLFKLNIYLLSDIETRKLVWLQVKPAFAGDVWQSYC